MTKQELLQQADNIADQIAQLTEQERELRKEAAAVICPEKVWEEIINGLIVKVDCDRFPNSVFFFKGDEVFFQLEKDTLWCRYNKVWMKISEAISGHYKATQAFIKLKVEEHFKMKGVTP